MNETWRTRLFGGRPAPSDPKTAPRAFAPQLAEFFAPRVGHTVELLEVTPHGGDLHLVVATVDGRPFREYIPTGDLAGDDPAAARRAIARRVRQKALPPAAPSDLTGREVGLP